MNNREFLESTYNIIKQALGEDQAKVVFVESCAEVIAQNVKIRGIDDSEIKLIVAYMNEVVNG